MVIVFLCGCLEPGRDGVGDYTRRLAGELIRQGNDCILIALNDDYIEQTTLAPQDSEGCSLRIFRLGAKRSWQARIIEAKRFCDKINPDWVSLQFVPYSFQAKGLPVGLGTRLKQLAPRAKWHVMFHELWIGMSLKAHFRERLVGALQRQLIRHIAKEIAPEAVATQSSLYVAQLRGLGLNPVLIPLFGNIPYQCGVNRRSNSKESSLNLVLFGGIHRMSPVGDFASECAAYHSTTGRSVRLTIAGRSGPEQVGWKEAWIAEGLEVNVAGERSPEEISKLLQSASFGITTTPLALIEKSGAAAAMLEHKLPVINVASQWIPRGGHRTRPPDGIYEYRPSELAGIIDNVEGVAINGPSLEIVAVQIGNLLKDFS